MALKEAMAMHVQKYMASCGVGSRRECEAFIAAGRVSVNGAVVQPGATMDPAGDKVTLDGSSVTPAKKVYVIINKPGGVISTVKDEDHRETVLDLVQGVEARLYPAGRLDREVEGAMLLTNDGEVTHRIASPDYPMDRVYIASVRGEMDEDKIRQLREGVVMDGDETVRAQARILHIGLHTTLLRVTFREGHKRSLRRLLAAVSHPVLELRSVAFANVHLGALALGEWRYLSHEEAESLRQRLGLCA
jgi:pseudouridine synthase